MNPKNTYLIFLLLSLTACGISTPGGYVLGTTGYLEVYNQGRQGERIPERDRAELASIVTKGGR